MRFKSNILVKLKQQKRKIKLSTYKRGNTRIQYPIRSSKALVFTKGRSNYEHIEKEIIELNTQSGALRRPSPPAFATAATSSGPAISGPKGPWTIPYSKPRIPFHPISLQPLLICFKFIWILYIGQSLSALQTGRSGESKLYFDTRPVNQ